jgi:hypothetical protein
LQGLFSGGPENEALRGGLWQLYNNEKEFDMIVMLRFRPSGSTERVATKSVSLPDGLPPQKDLFIEKDGFLFCVLRVTLDTETVPASSCIILDVYCPGQSDNQFWLSKAFPRLDAAGWKLNFKP